MTAHAATLVGTLAATLLAALVVTGTLAGPAQAQEPTIDEARDRVVEAEEKVEVAEAALAALLDEAESVQARLIALTRERDAAGARVQVASTSLTRSQDRLVAQTARLGSFAAALNRGALPDPALVLLTEPAAGDALAASSQYERLAGTQVATLTRLAEQRLALRQREVDLADDKARMADLTEQMAALADEVQQKVDAARTAVVTLEADLHELEAELRGLQEQERRRAEEARRAEQQRLAEQQRRLDALQGQASRNGERARPSSGSPETSSGATPSGPSNAASTGGVFPSSPPTGTGCTVPDPTSGGCITPTMAALMNQVNATFSPVPTYCWRAGGGDHAQGRACDLMYAPSGTYPAAAATARGWEVATWMVANADALGVEYVIWQGRIWLSSLGGQGWRPYNGYGPTAGHYDHVHVSVRR